MDGRSRHPGGGRSYPVRRTLCRCQHWPSNYVYKTTRAKDKATALKRDAFNSWFLSLARTGLQLISQYQAAPKGLLWVDCGPSVSGQQSAAMGGNRKFKKSPHQLHLTDGAKNPAVVAHFG